MLRPPYDVSYLRRISENWRHRRGLWLMLVTVIYRTGPVRCPLPFYTDYSALPARPPYGDRTATVRQPYDALMFCKNNPAATVRPPYGSRTMLRLLYPNRTVTVRQPHDDRTATVRRPCDARTMCKRSYSDRTVPVEIVRRPYGGRTIL